MKFNYMKKFNGKVSLRQVEVRDGRVFMRSSLI